MTRSVKLLCAFIVLVMVIGLSGVSGTADIPLPKSLDERLESAVVLYLNSFTALVNNREARIDPHNVVVTPVLKGNTVMVPVRFIAESLGGSIQWDGKKAAVMIILDGKRIELSYKSSTIAVNNTCVSLSAPVDAVKGRLMAPLNDYAAALGKKAFYEKGLIVISGFNSFFDGQADKDSINRVISMVNKLPAVGTYEMFTKLMEEAIASGGYANDKMLVKSRNAVVDIKLPENAKSMKTDEAGLSDVSQQNTASYSAGDYSSTNVQVQGVDEADVVKTDGEYIYQINKNRIVIMKAYPAEEMQLVSVTQFEDPGFAPAELYIHGQQLVVIGLTSGSFPSVKKDTAAKEKIACPPYRMKYAVRVIVYDMTDRKSLKKIREVELDGNYVSSRKIGSAVYFVTNRPIYYNPSEKADEDVKPYFRDSAAGNTCINVDYSQIRYFPGFVKSNYMLIAALNLDTQNEAVKVSAYLGAGENVYVSEESLYVAVTDYNAAYTGLKAAEGISPDLAGPQISSNSTGIYKFSLKGNDVAYLCRGEVPGTILNQFSMDENGSRFRIATTSGDMWRNDEHTSRNNIYVLDSALNITGRVENIAPGERIYSVRFMGDRAYAVTFRNVDPFYVIDLSQPDRPEILGALKLPGYSDYLHPYDENHIIGFGKDTVELKGGAYYLGMKISMFDVTDVSKPVVNFSEVIGDRGTESEILRNHKALLFSREKNLLAFPVTVMEVKSGGSSNRNAESMLQYGEFAFQGAYVYNVDLEKGFSLKGKITHLTADDYLKSGNNWYNSDKNINRILYINNSLYTLSNGMFKASSLADLKEIKAVPVP